jgi:hypothetical protein
VLDMRACGVTTETVVRTVEDTLRSGIPRRDR